MEIFQRNLENVTAFNREAEAKGLSMRLKINQFSDKEYSEVVSQRMGYKAGKKAAASNLPKSATLIEKLAASLPTSFGTFTFLS
jgi:hypothetical protein